ncbi:MAG: enoyl-CoA hydratase/isomerase family protein [Acidimicrobiia bacterium]
MGDPTTFLHERLAGGVEVVTLNRPDQLNAFDWTMRTELRDFWHGLRDDTSLRCVIVTGAGRAFCSGADAGMLSEPRRPFGDGLDDEISLVPGRTLPVPVIAAVNGVCAGGGLHFVADADIAICSSKASFTDPHVSVGQVTGIEPASLAARVPFEWVKRLALLGRHERWNAERALALGLVTEVVEPEALLPRAIELAGLIAVNSPAAVRSSLAVLRGLEAELVEQWMDKGWTAVMAHWPHPDAMEGPVAFSEKRDPVWNPDWTES